MTWYLLVLLYAAPIQPEMMGAWTTAAACESWFSRAEHDGDVTDVVAYKCVEVRP